MDILLTKPILISFIGGLVLSFLNLLDDQNKIPSERIPKDYLFFIAFVFWPLISGFLTFLYIDSGNEINSFLAFHIGISSPLILQTLVSKAALAGAQNSIGEES